MLVSSTSTVSESKSGGAAATKTINGVTFLGQSLTGVTGKDLPPLIDAHKARIGSGAVLLMIILGGLGDIRGALIAALALGCLEVVTAGYISSDLKEAVAFAALVLTLWIRPTGLFGRTARRRA